MMRLTAVCLCWFGLFTATAMAASPLRYVGVVDNSAVSTDSEVSKTSMGLVKDAGFNSVRVIMTWQYPGQNEIKNDQIRICNAASAAADNGLRLFLDIVTVARSGQYGAPPDSSHQITWLDKTIGDYMWALIGPNGCAQNLPELDIEVGNEPNYSVFCRPLERCPQIYAQMLSRTYTFVHQLAANGNFQVPIKVIGGELAMSHDPVGFISQLGTAMTNLGVTGPAFDMFSYHCYGTGDSQQASPPDSIRSALKQAFGTAPPLLCSEYGVGTLARQRKIQDASSTLVLEAQQAQLGCQALAMGTNSGLSGVFWFHLFNDPPGHGWLSGLYYFDPALGQPGDTPIAKSSLPAFRQANQLASSPLGITCG